MEIENKFILGKINLLIKDYDSNLLFSNSFNIKDYVYDNILSKDSVIIDNVDLLFYELSVEEVINNFIYKYNLKGKKNIDKLLNLSTLPVYYLKKDPYYLNNSEKFKLLLTLLLSLNPKTIIIKNISCFLDNMCRDEIIFVLKKLRREHGKTIIIIDNDIDYFYTVCDVVLVVHENQLLFQGKKNILYDKYNILKRKKIPIPVCLEFIKYVKDHKCSDILVRDDVKDIMKDIYRCL